MADRPNVLVAPVTPERAPAVRALRVAADQYPYVGDVALNLAGAEADPDSEAMAILYDDTERDAAVIGFYRLDYRPTAMACNAIGPGGVGMRAFLLDRAWQGRGLGVRAVTACCEDLRRRHPERCLLALNVNCRNLAAIRAYRRAGFVDTGRFYFGGSAGPQHLMVRELEDQ